ncbi:hypothetical protein FGLOB1_274 [Fusarium globosum]|uniref:Uncharacterized protein n=1 Tax=Fusarium globosum TaxID=78864 RepID=A0A8H5YZA9_9HYPO|nr:hypothetical protein FGLOB1_274 [Fusarium globosum]
METLKTSQCHISLEELVAKDERDDLHLDIVNKFDQALNTGKCTQDQAADEADNQKEPESSTRRSGTGSEQSMEEQQLDAKAQTFADKLDELW